MSKSAKAESLAHPARFAPSVESLMVRVDSTPIHFGEGRPSTVIHEDVSGEVRSPTRLRWLFD
ncbi:hypothetical protein CGZ80_16170 [Rhodopirellula sp. MGV]|nr:hypothetical protein CGZ80_16170 [Rhodopirellula sp. MGV]